MCLTCPCPLQIRSGSGRTPTTSRKGRCSSSSMRCTQWLTLCTTCTRSFVRARWASALKWTPSTALTCSSTSAASTLQVSRVLRLPDWHGLVPFQLAWPRSHWDCRGKKKDLKRKGSLQQHGNLKLEREVFDLLIQSDFIHKPQPTANKYTLGRSTAGQDWRSQPESNYGHAAAALTWRERDYICGSFKMLEKATGILSNTPDFHDTSSQLPGIGYSIQCLAKHPCLSRVLKYQNKLHVDGVWQLKDHLQFVPHQG